MKKELVILIAVLLLIMILIVVFSNDTTQVTGNYTNIEIQMRKLWY